MSIASEIQALQANKAAIKAAIEAKNPSVAPTEVMSNWPASIASIPSGQSSGEKDVNFRDYDGTLLHSFTKDEVADMTVLPSLPTRNGFTCQGWNWTLSQIKSYVASYGVCEIGAVYITDDGKTRIKLTISNYEYRTAYLVFKQTVANGVVLDWGDGSATETYSSTANITASHTYTPSSFPTEYLVTFQVLSGKLSFPVEISGLGRYDSASVQLAMHNDMITALNIGENFSSFGNYAFYYCNRLEEITIPEGITSIAQYVFYLQSGRSGALSVCLPNSLRTLGNYCFSYVKFKAVALPGGLTTMNTGCLMNTTIPYLIIPSGVKSITGYTLQQVTGVVKVVFPDSITSVGNNALYNFSFPSDFKGLPPRITSFGTHSLTAYNLEKLEVPSGVKSIPQNFIPNSITLKYVVLPPNATSIGNTAFQYCSNIRSMAIPSTVTSIGSSAFQACYSITEINIPDRVTAINASAFSTMHCLPKLQFPPNLSSIAASAFASDYALKVFDFRRATKVPTLANINAFTNTPADKEIIVPDDLYNTWVATSNWSDSSIVGNIVKASQSSLGPLV